MEFLPADAVGKPEALTFFLWMQFLMGCFIDPCSSGIDRNCGQASLTRTQCNVIIYTLEWLAVTDQYAALH
ncbi:hypothetical protein R1flu_023412 [Riccia fluitans]|uniref:Uncharacterized protein n=1 Tax=Riccia fluitans TaxID=41844 RepID=A0ABD1XRY1_9MARC